MARKKLPSCYDAAGILREEMLSNSTSAEHQVKKSSKAQKCAKCFSKQGLSPSSILLKIFLLQYLWHYFAARWPG